MSARYEAWLSNLKRFSNRRSRGDRKRMLLVCAPRSESVGAAARIFGEVEFLSRDPQIDLAVFWWAGAQDFQDVGRLEWIKRKIDECPVPVWITRPGKVFGRVWGAVSLVSALFAWRAFVIHAHQPSLARRSSSLARWLPLRVIADFHGSAPEELAFAGRSADEIEAAGRAEESAARDSHAVICVSDAMVDHLKRKYRLTGNKFRVVPCCVAESRARLDWEERRRLRESLGVDDRLVMVYSGGVAEYQCVPDMCRLFAELRRSTNAFWLILTWADGGVFEKALQDLGVPASSYKIMSLPTVEVSRHLMIADAALVLRDSNVLNKVSCPTKVAEYLGAGVPIVTTPHVGDVPGWVSSAGLGFVTEPPPHADVPALTDFLQGVVRDRRQYAERCVSFAATRLTWSANRDSFYSAYGWTK